MGGGGRTPWCGNGYYLPQSEGTVEGSGPPKNGDCKTALIGYFVVGEAAGVLGYRSEVSVKGNRYAGNAVRLGRCVYPAAYYLYYSVTVF